MTHVIGPKTDIEAPFSYILDAQGRSGSARITLEAPPLQPHLGLNHLLFNAAEDPSPSTESDPALSDHCRALDAQLPAARCTATDWPAIIVATQTTYCML